MPRPKNALSINDGGNPYNPLSAADVWEWQKQNASDAWKAAQDPQTWRDAANQYGQALLMGSVAPMKIGGPLKGVGQAGYVYHITNAERAAQIAQDGKLLTHKPHEFTEQDAWPDGATEKRNYFTKTPDNSYIFAPEYGDPTLLRAPQDAHPFKTEKGTGDMYSTKPVPSKKMEFYGEDGQWYPLSGYGTE
jgi:hypothetical protein